MQINYKRLLAEILLIAGIVLFMSIHFSTGQNLSMPNKSKINMSKVDLSKNDKIDSTTLNTIKERGLDKMSKVELAVQVVKQDSAIQETQDSLVKQSNKINELKDSIKNNLLGGLTLGNLISAFIFALIGMFIRWGYKTVKAVKKDETTPANFNIIFWFKDNSHKIFRVLTSLAIVYVFLIFSKQLIGVEISMIVAFFIGLFIDVLADYLMTIKPPFVVPEVKVVTKEQEIKSDNPIQ